MSNNLISREDVLKIIYDIKDDENIPKNYGTLLDINRIIRAIPIAYDIEKVVEELTKYEIECEHSEYYSMAEIKEIVKRGGIE